MTSHGLLFEFLGLYFQTFWVYCLYPWQECSNCWTNLRFRWWFRGLPQLKYEINECSFVIVTSLLVSYLLCGLLINFICGLWLISAGVTPVEQLAKSTISERVVCPPLSLRVVDSYGEWTTLWESQFTALNIPHLRSHTLVHTDPLNKVWTQTNSSMLLLQYGCK